MKFTIVPLLGSLVFTFVNFLRYLKGGDMNGVVTQIIAWAAGVGAVMLVAQTQFASSVPITNTYTLATLSGWSLFFVGLMATSLFSTVNEVLKAVDNTQTQAKPNLIDDADTPKVVVVHD